MTHLGRPKGQVAPEFSVAPVAVRLSELLGCPVPVEADLLGQGAHDAVAALTDGDVVMMENLRFHREEEANDPGFAAALARLGDIYVGDAFSCTHRAHASVEALPRLMEVATAGRALGEELSALHAALALPYIWELLLRVDILMAACGRCRSAQASEGVVQTKAVKFEFAVTPQPFKASSFRGRIFFFFEF